MPRRRGADHPRGQAPACDPYPLWDDRLAGASLGARRRPHAAAGCRGQGRARWHVGRAVSAQQRFLLLLILVGALATVLGLVSKRARLLPYPVVLAAAGVVVGLLPGGALGHVGADVMLLAFVPGLAFQAALAPEPPGGSGRLLPVGPPAPARRAPTRVPHRATHQPVPGP